jgi:hypothetical protein
MALSREYFFEVCIVIVLRSNSNVHEYLSVVLWVLLFTATLPDCVTVEQIGGKLCSPTHVPNVDVVATTERNGLYNPESVYIPNNR